MISFIKKYFLSTIVIVLVLILCLMESKQFPAPPMENFDKLVHMIMFFGISGIIFFDNTGYLRYPSTKFRIFWSSFLFPSFLSGLIEILQNYLTETRFGDWNDFFFGVIGTFFGFIVSFSINCFLFRIKNKR